MSSHSLLKLRLMSQLKRQSRSFRLRISGLCAFGWLSGDRLEDMDTAELFYRLQFSPNFAITPDIHAPPRVHETLSKPMR